MLIPVAFQKLVAGLQPLPSEMAGAFSHASTIKSRLVKEFNVRKFVMVGSHSRRTAIRNFSDVDYFAVFSREDVRWGGSLVRSSTVLNRLRDELASRYWQTGVSRDAQAIVVDFAGGARPVDVVPAFFKEFGVGWPIYEIPDGQGGWMRASPEAHTKYLKNEDERSGGKLKRVVQMLKYWRECRTPRVPLKSFHLEIVLAVEGVCVGVKPYSECLIDAFHILQKRECRAIQDPMGISGLVPSTATDSQRIGAITSLRSALSHALSAWDAERNGKIDEAKRQWNIVFNSGFPY